MIDLPSEVAQLSPKFVGRLPILMVQGNPKGTVSGRLVQVSGVLGGFSGERSAKFFQQYMYVRQFQRGLFFNKCVIDLYLDLDWLSLLFSNW